MSENRVIGDRGRLPWHLPDDFKWFKAKTTGQVVVMGRKTFEAIGKPLPGRTTVVLTRSGFNYPGIRIAHSLDEIDPERESGGVFICGGADVYRQTLDRWSDLFLTLVKQVVEGDVFFPPFEDRYRLHAVLQDCSEFSILHYRQRP